MNCLVVRTFVPPTPAEIAEHLTEFPLREMVRRGWIAGDPEDLVVMQAELEEFFRPRDLPSIRNAVVERPDIEPRQ